MRKSVGLVVPAGAARGMLGAVRKRGLLAPDRVDAILSEAGIDPDDLDGASACVPAAECVVLFDALTSALDDEMLGFLSRPLRQGTYALLARVALTATTPAGAMHRIAETLTLLQDDIVATCETGDGGVGMVFRPRDERSLMRFGYELLTRGCWRLAAWLQGGHPTPIAFDFPFDRPDDIEAYSSAYSQIFAPDVRFGRPHAAFWFDAGDMRVPLRRGARDLQDFLRSSPANIIVPGLAPSAVGIRVQSLLRLSAPDWPSLQETARRLHMSPSTLQRSLALERTSFTDLKEALRRDMAIHALRTSTDSMAAIAAKVGFADAAVFQRAFRTWTGQPPGVFRSQGR